MAKFVLMKFVEFVPGLNLVRLNPPHWPLATNLTSCLDRNERFTGL